MQSFLSNESQYFITLILNKSLPDLPAHHLHWVSLEPTSYSSLIFFFDPHFDGALPQIVVLEQMCGRRSFETLYV